MSGQPRMRRADGSGAAGHAGERRPLRTLRVIAAPSIAGRRAEPGPPPAEHRDRHRRPDTHGEGALGELRHRDRCYLATSIRPTSSHTRSRSGPALRTTTLLAPASASNEMRGGSGGGGHRARSSRTRRLARPHGAGRIQEHREHRAACPSRVAPPRRMHSSGGAFGYARSSTRKALRRR